jgi:hypothetical protein
MTWFRRRQRSKYSLGFGDRLDVLGPVIIGAVIVIIIALIIWNGGFGNVE